jgi:hypothetical protein
MTVMKLMSEDVHADLVTPLILEDATSGEKQYFIEGIFMEADVMNGNKRIYPRTILESQVEAYNKIISQGMAYGELDHPSCQVDKKFEVLTQDGWKKFEDVLPSDKLMNMDVSTKSIKYDNITKIINQPYDGIGYHFKTRTMDLKVSPTHKFLLAGRGHKLGYYTVQEILENRTKFSKYYIPKKTLGKSDNGICSVVIPKVDVENPSRYKNDPSVDLELPSDIYASFMGLYLAEGHVANKDGCYSITITQVKEHNKQPIRDLLASMNLGYVEYDRHFTITDRRLSEYLSPLGICYDKFVPNDVKELDQVDLNLFIDWFILGDGRTYNQYPSSRPSCKRRNLFSTSERLIDDISEIVTMVGMGTKKFTETCGADYYFADRLIESKNKKDLFVLEILSTNGNYLDKRHLDIVELQPTEHDGGLFSFEMENDSNYIIRDHSGYVYINGNCATVTMKDVSHRITELKMDGNNVIGKAVLLDNELGRTCKSALKTGGKLAVSSRGVGTLGEGSIVNPDFRLVTVDIVSNPSAPNAFVNGILENKEYILENNVLIEHHIGTLDRALATKGCVKTTEEIINTWIKSL